MAQLQLNMRSIHLHQGNQVYAILPDCSRGVDSEKFYKKRENIRCCGCCMATIPLGSAKP
ncbi:MAG: hypothetical protein ACLUO4_03660 [Christensenellales bacterium]